MYRVKFIESVASAKFSYKPGEECFLEPDQAKAWAEQGVLKIIGVPEVASTSKK